MKIVAIIVILIGIIFVFISAQGAYIKYQKNEQIRKEAETPYRSGAMTYTYRTPPYSIWNFWHGDLVLVALLGFAFIISGTTLLVRKSRPTKICPYCAENIKQKAVLCRYCGKGLS